MTCDRSKIGERNSQAIHRRLHRASSLLLPALAVFLFCALAISAQAATYTLNSGKSPISVSFDGVTGRMSVTVKSSGMTWNNGTAGGGDTLACSNVKQIDGLNLTCNATTENNYALTLALGLNETTGDLTVTIGGNPTVSIPKLIQYPYAFFPADGSGFAVLPFDAGFVIPTTKTDYPMPNPKKPMEWLGGVDAAVNQGWIWIADTSADYDLEGAKTTVAGNARLGGVMEWLGSNGNASHTPNCLSYNRVAIGHFFTSGGYVAQAKHFRQYAAAKGWLKTLAQKNAEDPKHKVDKMIGAPLIYLWGDGRSTEMLKALHDAGFQKAQLMISTGNFDQNERFPNQQFAREKNGWSNQVRSYGFIPGIYDIYNRMNGSSPNRYFGAYYLWPKNANPDWAMINANGTYAGGNADRSAGGRISHVMAAPFARDTRVPSWVNTFGFDAFFTDTLGALALDEDYSSSHFATRAIDIKGRQDLLNAICNNPHTGPLLSGTERMCSWAVPYTEWGEGVSWVGNMNAARGINHTQVVGRWNDQSYPAIMTDVVDPTTNVPDRIGPQLGNLLDDGYQAPLFDLVFHDAVITPTHWIAPHNKFLYCWDKFDLAALIRGQAPALSLTYAGAKGQATRVPISKQDKNGLKWSMEWTNANESARVKQTYNTVCAFHAKVGYMEMTNHKWLTDDRSVQMSEFSNDGGATGIGIVVNFGVYDGAYGMKGSAWNGAIRGNNLSVPLDSDYKTYSWSAAPASSAGR